MRRALLVLGACLLAIAWAVPWPKHADPDTELLPAIAPPEPQREPKPRPRLPTERYPTPDASLARGRSKDKRTLARPKPASVLVRVVDDLGNPVPGISIAVLPAAALPATALQVGLPTLNHARLVDAILKNPTEFRRKMRILQRLSKPMRKHQRLGGLNRLRKQIAGQGIDIDALEREMRAVQAAVRQRATLGYPVSAVGTTRSDGTVVLRPIAPGAAFVRTTANSRQIDWALPKGERRIALSSGQQALVQIVAPRKARLRVHLSRAASDLVRLWAFRLEKRSDEPEFVHRLRSRASPDWRIAPGNYRIECVLGAGMAFVARAQTVHLAAGRTSDLEIKLEKAHSVLEGVLTRMRDGQPLRRVVLRVTPTGYCVRAARTDRSGRFVVQGLPNVPLRIEAVTSANDIVRITTLPGPTRGAVLRITER